MNHADAPTSRGDLETAIRAERAALAEDLAMLTEEQWRHSTWCDRWDVEQVVAHLVAGATIGRWRWLASIVAARFDPAVHNDRRLAEHRGATPAETLDRFRAIVDGPAGPSGHTAAWLGEVVVHGEDIRRPLGLESRRLISTHTAVARFFAQRDFTVTSRKAIAGLRLQATDGPFAAGTGPLVSGPTLALVLAMAGRRHACHELSGEGLPTLRDRVS